MRLLHVAPNPKPYNEQDSDDGSARFYRVLEYQSLILGFRKRRLKALGLVDC